MQYLKWLCLIMYCLAGCQAANYLTIDDCDADRDGDFALGECGGNDCNDQNGRMSSLLGEVCNDGIDNNCNGQIDENCNCTNADPPRNCYTDQDGKSFSIIVPPAGISASTCRPGQQVCNAGHWGACLGAQGPAPEICDYKDNDCDGVPDNGIKTDLGELLNSSCTRGRANTSCQQKGIVVCISGKADCSVMGDVPINQFIDVPRNSSFDNNCDGNIEQILCSTTKCDIAYGIFESDTVSCNCGCGNFRDVFCCSKTVTKTGTYGLTCGQSSLANDCDCKYDTNGVCKLNQTGPYPVTFKCK